MGGFGSGSYYRWNTRETVEDYRSIDVLRWSREGFLKGHQFFSWKWTRDGEQIAAVFHQGRPITPSVARRVSTWRNTPPATGENKMELLPAIHISISPFQEFTPIYRAAANRGIIVTSRGAHAKKIKFIPIDILRQNNSVNRIPSPSATLKE